MVKHWEALDLEPSPEDILSVWGKELTAQNVDWYFGAVGSQGCVKPSVEGTVYNISPRVSLEERLDPEVQGKSDTKGLQEESLRNEYSHCAIPRLIQGRRGKGLISSPILSGGLEDIVNLGAARGIRTSADSERGPAVIRPVNAENLVNPSRIPAAAITETGEYVDPRSSLIRSGNERLEEVHEPIGGLKKFSGGDADPEISTQRTSSNQQEGVPQKTVNTQAGEEGLVVNKSGEKRKKSKPIKKKDIEDNLVLGMDVQVEEAIEVAECTLVGRARGKKHTTQFIKKWGEQVWQTDLVKEFKVAALAKGWFRVRFENKEAADWVMARNWAFGNYPILFKRWSPMFDAMHERTDTFPVWVRAPGLPSFLWVESVFRSIGNRLGTFLEADMSFLQTQNMAMARILVNLNPRGGLAEKINIQYREYVFEQILDYEHLPFRCHRCHVYGHLARDCPLGKRRRRNQKPPEDEGMYADQEHHVQELEIKKNPVTESMEVDYQLGEKELEQIPVSSPGRDGRNGTEPDKERTPGSEPVNESPIQKPINEFPASMSTSPAEDLPGMRLDSSNPSLTLSESKDDCLITSLNTKKCPLDDQLHIENFVENITAAIPSIDLNCEDEPPEEAKPVSASLTCHYNLRSLDKKPERLGSFGGIGRTSPQIKKVRGRKSSLSNAKVRAKIDVADGKQMTIHGALRAVNPQETVIK